MFASFKEIIELWPTRAQLARAIDIKAEVVVKWHQRDFIPPEYWLRIVSASSEFSQPVTLYALAALAKDRLDARLDASEVAA
jgi:hypothetical protein